MAQQEEGWPLGLQPLNARVGLVRNGTDFSGSVSFNTLITGSPTSSTDSSSDLDTESTGSFFHDRSITLGSLIGVSNILELSRKSTRVRKSESTKEKKIHKSKTWFFSLCSRDSTDAYPANNAAAPSLGHFLAVERRAATECRRNQFVNLDAPDEFTSAPAVTEPNSLFVNGQVAPPTLSPWFGNDDRRRRNEGDSVPVLFSCMCGQPC